MNQLDIQGRRVAFFGGSFDPPHLGHLAVARAARAALGLDTVLFAPVGAQPLKPAGSSASFEDRVAMTRLAIDGEPGFELSLADAPKPDGSPNFTIDTLRLLRAQMPVDSRLFLLMGADSLSGLRHWYRSAEIPFVARLVVAARPGLALDSLQSMLPVGLTVQPMSGEIADEVQKESLGQVRCHMLTNPAGERAPLFELAELDVGISASRIRQLARGQCGSAERGPDKSDELLPAAVAEYVRAHALYC
jgi:nicotinate-nucleotide adenylyltransferase